MSAHAHVGVPRASPMSYLQGQEHMGTGGADHMRACGSPGRQLTMATSQRGNAQPGPGSAL